MKSRVIDPEVVAAPPEPTGVPGLIGRTREFGLLRERLAAATTGRGAIVAIGGEPGIGKTRLLQAIAAFAQTSGATVVWGRCYEGDWTPPYGPWLELLTDLLRGAAPERLRLAVAALGPGAAALARLLPDSRVLIPELAAPAPLSPEEERFRLHDAVVRFVLAAPHHLSDGDATPPLLLVLDDLQWADRPSLQLVQHLGRQVDRSRVLTVVTYRDGTLDREHPLTETLAALRRESSFVGLVLKGLDPDDVTELIARTARREISQELGRAIHGETGGNPFYVHEVTRHLLNEGALGNQTDRWSADQSIRELGVPEGVRQVVGRRLARLAQSTRQLLEHAAVFTAGVDFPVLLALTNQSEDELLDALDEALAAQLLRPVDNRQETYDFAHAIVRQALVAEWSRNPSRAARLHRRAAEALEQVHGEHSNAATVAELAIQYHASTAIDGAARGLSFALAAADHAQATFAREQRVIFLRIARDLAMNLDPGSRGAILARLATAEAESLLLTEAEATTHMALVALQASDAAPDRVASFLATMADALSTVGAEDHLWRPLIEQGLALVSHDHGLTWARLMLLRHPVERLASDTIRAGRWRGYDAEAIRVARHLGNEQDYARTVDSFDARTSQETHALISLARGWTRPTAILRGLTVAANDLQYRHGAFREALDLWHEVRDLAERFGAIGWQAQAFGQLMALHLAFGQFDQARQAGARAAELVARLGPQGGGGGEPEELAAERATTFALFLDGDWSRIAASWRQSLSSSLTNGNYVTTLNGPLVAAMAAAAAARAGNADETIRLLTALVPVLEALDPAASTQAQSGAIAYAADAIWTLAERNLAAPCRRLALAAIAAGVGDCPQCSNELSVARMATLLGQLPEAQEYFGRARAVLDASGQRPLRAIVDFDEAVALHRLDVGNGRIVALLEHAIAAFGALGMAGWTHRARQLMETAAARAPAAGLPAGLSEREAEVARLVARGFSDRQIADELFISPRTVNAHIRNLLNKTDRINRTDLAAWAVEHGIAAAGEA